jgi:type IV secretion system protein TrbF
MTAAKDIMQTPVGQRTATPPMTAHHDAARRGWNDRLENERSHATRWRMAFFASAATALALAIGLVISTNQPPVKPLVVRVENDGSASVVGKAGASSFDPSTNEFRYFISHWIKLVRAVPLDPVVIKSNWDSAYSFMTPQAANKLNAWAREPGSPLANVGGTTTLIQVESVLPVSEKSYQARWSETTYTDAGVVKEVATWTSTFTVQISPPTTDAQTYQNPLGLLINDFNWNRDLSR